MKIAILVNPLIAVPPKQYGGIERIVFMLIQELLKKGHMVTLYAHQDSQPGCQLVVYEESKSYGMCDFFKINKLTMKIAFERYDLVHTFGRMSNIAGLLVSRLPKLVSYQLPPTVSQVKKAVRIAPGKSLYFTACSDYIRQSIAPYATVTTIYNGVNIQDYHPNYVISPNAPLVFLGRIQKEKGTAIAIEAAKKSGRNLIIAGNIPDEPLHQQYFNEAVKPWIDDRQIKYVGPVDDRQKNELLRNACALLMPVLWDEPFGIVMAEALACGTPVIGFERGAVPEVITEGVNGFLCKDMSDMVNGIIMIEQISRRECREIAERKFSSTVLAEQYEALYQKMLCHR